MPAKPKIWVFWRFIGELWDAKVTKKSENLPDCAKITIFNQVAVSQKKFILKGWFTFVCKVCMVLFTETKLSVYPQLFVISLGAENGTNFKKSEIVSWKPIFEALYLLNNALEYIYPT